MLAIQQRLSSTFYILLSLPATAMGFALSVQISALSWILSTQYGLDIHQIGLVWAAGPIAGILGQVIIGMLSDKVWFWQGRRRPFILIGGFFAALSLLALPNIDIISASTGIEQLLGIAITVALTLDLSINISFNPTRAIIADVTPTGHERTKGYTWMQTISGSFGVLAYAIGAVFGNITLIYVGAILALLLSLIPPFFIEEPESLSTNQQTSLNSHSDTHGWRDILRYIKPLWGFVLYDVYAMLVQLFHIKLTHHWIDIGFATLILYFVFSSLNQHRQDSAIHSFQQILAAHSFSWIGVQTMFVYMFAFLQQKMSGISDEQLGQIISTSFLIMSAVSAILPALVLQPLAKKLGRIKTHSYCLSIMTLAYLLVALFGHNIILLYLLMAIVGIGWAAIISLPFAIMSERVKAADMGLFMGLFNLSVVLPQLLVSLGVGLFISQFDDKSVVFYISATALCISSIAWFKVKE